MFNGKRTTLTKAILFIPNASNTIGRNKLESPQGFIAKKSTYCNFSQDSKIFTDKSKIINQSTNIQSSNNPTPNMTIKTRKSYKGKVLPFIKHLTVKNSIDISKSSTIKPRIEALTACDFKYKRKGYNCFKNNKDNDKDLTAKDQSKDKHSDLNHTIFNRSTSMIFKPPSVIFKQQSINYTYYYIIKPENCGRIVKKCFEHRINWHDGFLPNASTQPIIFNFLWQQNKVGIDYGILSKYVTHKQMVNHFEFNTSISNKANVFINLMRYCEQRDDEVFRYVPLTILFLYQQTNFIQKFASFNELFSNIKTFIHPMHEISRSNKFNKRPMYNTSFPFMDKLGYKTTLGIPSSHFNQKNLWIIKAPDLNRGHCIKILNGTSQILKIIKSFSEGILKGYATERDKIGNPYENDTVKVYTSDVVIVQKYIERPLLYNGRKFDIRMWVILTHKMQVFLFKEGHMKTCSVDYDINTINSYSHLTNYSLQKRNDNFSKFETGNEVSFEEFQAYIDKYHSDKNISFRSDIYPKLMQIIEMTFFSVKTKINSLDRKYCFEIFGYDFMLDEDFNPFLIEVNMNPGLEESSPLIKMLVPRMLDDALRLTVDELFNTQYAFDEVRGDKEDSGRRKRMKENYISPFNVKNYGRKENLWEFVCDLNRGEEYNFTTGVLFKFRYKMHYGVKNMQK